LNFKNISKYFKKPILVASCIFIVGFIFAILGVGAGGASAIFVVFGWFGGLFAMFTYWLVLAFKSGNKFEIILVPLTIVFIGLVSSYGTLFNKQCVVTNDFALERIKKHLINTEQPLTHLGHPELKTERCEVWVDYVGNGDDITYIVSDYGKLHMDTRKGSPMR
tara:strand:- start:3922 stop:4413 length:492 start_codon:yes stop_codon:yes gene_type:complete